MELNEFLVDFGKIVGVPDLRVDEDEHCALSVDEMVVHLQADKLHDALLIHGEVSELPSECGEGFFRALLEMNYLFSGTRGATLSLKPESDMLELAILLPGFTYCSMEKMLKILESFVNSLETLRNFIQDYRSGVNAKTASAETEDSGAEAYRGIRV